MPRCVRNFWIDADVDGKAHPIASGPRNKEGGFTEVIYIRDGGDVREAVEIRGYVSNGRLHLHVRNTYNGKSKPIHIQTER